MDIKGLVESNFETHGLYDDSNEKSAAEEILEDLLEE